MTGRTSNFANYDPHANRHDRARNPLYYYTGKFMEWLLIGVFTFFGIHTLLWFDFARWSSALGAELVRAAATRRARS